MRKRATADITACNWVIMLRVTEGDVSRFGSRIATIGYGVWLRLRYLWGALDERPFRSGSGRSRDFILR
jgi:hypothetical protein